MERRTALGLIGATAVSTILSPETAVGHGPQPAFGFRLESLTGVPLATFHFGGRRWVLGSYGQPYRIRVTNPTHRRVEAVLSVDGRDAISGRPGNYLRERGYIVPAGGSVVVRGFRQSLSHVAQFRFTHPSNSYGARMGTPENVGVVGVAFFKEASRRWQRPHRARERSADESPEPRASESRKPAPNHGEAESRNNLGTEYGESRYSPVSEVYFRRNNQRRPDRIVTLHYDDVEGLRARGVLQPAPPPEHPMPFPESGFAPPPP